MESDKKAWNKVVLRRIKRELIRSPVGTTAVILTLAIAALESVPTMFFATLKFAGLEILFVLYCLPVALLIFQCIKIYKTSDYATRPTRAVVACFYSMCLIVLGFVWADNLRGLEIDRVESAIVLLRTELTEIAGGEVLPRESNEVKDRGWSLGAARLVSLVAVCAGVLFWAFSTLVIAMGCVAFEAINELGNTDDQ